MDAAASGLTTIFETPEAPRIAAKAESTSTAKFSLCSLFLSIAWLCALLALGKVAIGFSLILAAISLPAVARTSWLTEQYQCCGRQISAAQKGGLFITSLAVLALAIGAGVGAFVAACFILLEVVATLDEVLPFAPVVASAVLALGLGGAMALGFGLGTQAEKLFRPRFLAHQPEA